MFLIRTHIDFLNVHHGLKSPDNLFVIDAYDLMINDILESTKENEKSVMSF